MTTWAWMETSSALTGSSQHDQRGLDRQGAGDADALALAAGELVRVAGGVIGREADEAQQFGDPRLPGRPVADRVDDQRLLQDVAARSCAG